MPSHHQHRPLLGLALRVLAAMLVATLFMLGKLLGQRGVSLTETLFWTRSITLPMLLSWLWWRRSLPSLATKRLGSHGFRAACGMVSMGLNFTAARMLSLSEFTILSFTAPLFAVIISALYLREHVGIWRWGAVVCGFLGVVLIAGPGDTAIPLLGGACGLLAALSIALISFQIRDLGKTEEPICSVFWYAVFGSAFMAVTLPFVAHGHDPGTWALLLLLGVVGAIGQLLLTASLQYGAVASVMIVDTTQLLWAILYGRLVWNEMPPSTLWLGAPLVIAGGLVIAWREYRLSKRNARFGRKLTDGRYELRGECAETEAHCAAPANPVR
ncbi:MAG: DMT family transporter [Sphingorhabdus sp.]